MVFPGHSQSTVYSQTTGLEVNNDITLGKCNLCSVLISGSKGISFTFRVALILMCSEYFLSSFQLIVMASTLVVVCSKVQSKIPIMWHPSVGSDASLWNIFNHQMNTHRAHIPTCPSAASKDEGKPLTHVLPSRSGIH